MTMAVKLVLPFRPAVHKTLHLSEFIGIGWDLLLFPCLIEESEEQEQAEGLST